MIEQPKRGRPAGSKNPNAGRKPGSKNQKPSQREVGVTVYLSKQEKAQLDMVCEFEGLTQKQILMSGVMGLMIKGAGLPNEALKKLSDIK